MLGNLINNKWYARTFKKKKIRKKYRNQFNIDDNLDEIDFI